jgi:D-alanine-D-alanine ligase
LKLVVLPDDVAGSSNPDDQDVFGQAAAVEAALAASGREVSRMPLGLDLARARAALERERPDLVFNLVESLGGSGRLIHVAPALLDALGLPYTGCPTEAILLASNKLLAKRLLARHGLPTPGWLEPGGGPPEAGRFIVKSVWEDASIGLDDGALVALRPGDDVAALLRERAPRLGGAAFAESYVEGREMQISLLADRDGVEVLPPSEILFSAWPPGKPRIVSYAAKWHPASFEYRHTARRLALPPEDGKLQRQLCELALRCWELFGLAGYARVDFRVDADGRPWILEVNPNPALTDETGLAGAAAAAGLRPADVIERIVACALAAP